MTKNETLLLIVPLFYSSYKCPYLWDPKLVPNIHVAKNLYVNASVRSHTHIGKLERYKDNPKTCFQARSSLMYSEQKVYTHEGRAKVNGCPIACSSRSRLRDPRRSAKIGDIA